MESGGLLLEAVEDLILKVLVLEKVHAVAAVVHDLLDDVCLQEVDANHLLVEKSDGLLEGGLDVLGAELLGSDQHPEGGQGTVDVVEVNLVDIVLDE